MSNLNECLQSAKEIAIFALGFILGFMTWELAKLLEVLLK